MEKKRPEYMFALEENMARTADNTLEAATQAGAIGADFPDIKNATEAIKQNTAGSNANTLEIKRDTMKINENTQRIADILQCGCDDNTPGIIFSEQSNIKAQYEGCLEVAPGERRKPHYRLYGHEYGVFAWDSFRSGGYKKGEIVSSMQTDGSIKYFVSLKDANADDPNAGVEGSWAEVKFAGNDTDFIKSTASTDSQIIANMHYAPDNKQIEFTTKDNITTKFAVTDKPGIQKVKTIMGRNITFAGDGTDASPLTATVPDMGGGMSKVVHDTTLAGNGTASSPLKVADNAYIIGERASSRSSRSVRSIVGESASNGDVSLRVTTVDEQGNATTYPIQLSPPTVSGYYTHQTYVGGLTDNADLLSSDVSHSLVFASSAAENKITLTIKRVSDENVIQYGGYIHCRAVSGGSEEMFDCNGLNSTITIPIDTSETITYKIESNQYNIDEWAIIMVLGNGNIRISRMTRSIYMQNILII